MNPAVADQLIILNHQFYQDFGGSFASTRKRIQPGVRKILKTIISDGIWMDMGCGSGNFAAAWREQLFDGTYVGIDFSTELLKEAVAAVAVDGALPENILFFQADLTKNEWMQAFRNQPFDGVVSFATLHHIPGEALQRQFLQQALTLLKPGKPFVLSVWQFQNSEKMLKRVIPWDQFGINEADVDSGDVMLDWRADESGKTGKRGYRYVHLFNPQRLRKMAEETGFTIVDEFTSDGASGDLALYLTMRKR